MSSHFHVIEFVEVEGACVGVKIYSSKTTAWIFKESEWDKGSIVRHSKSRSVFLNGFMHMVEYSAIVVVDTEAEIWRTIPKPVWKLEDYGTDNWILKHVMDTEELFGRMNIKVGSELCDEEYRVIIVHLEWNFIFLIGKDRTLIAYDMDRIKSSKGAFPAFCRYDSLCSGRELFSFHVVDQR
ncbi:uncharacterized protein [Miscanthus floridulus]|uniref:uncharacterized protein n=1 Tax=Miscanthus floridulus TaxID=154761 RepID=UPI00345A8051